MEEQRKRGKEEVVSDQDTDSDVIEIGSSRSDGGKRRRPTTPPDLHEVVVLEEASDIDHTRPTRSRRRKKKSTSRPPTPPHVEQHYISSSGESEEDEDEREEREAKEAGLYYCGPQDPYPAVFEDDAASTRAPEDEGFLSLRDLEEANTTATHPGNGLAADYDDGIEWRECAICLSRPTRRDGAVVEGCYHSFCFVCIAHWAALNPACPLCKRRFNAVLHDLRLMPGPAARLHFRRYSLADAAAAAAVVSPSSSHPATRNVASRARASVAATSTRDVAVGILQASTHKASGEMSYGGSAPSASDTDVDRRRRVYARCLRAVPPAALTTASSEGPGSSLELAFARRLPDVAREWETKLKPWVVRELQAVLEEDDVDLLAIMTRSLLDDYARRTLPLRRGRINAATAGKKKTTTTATAARASASSTTADERAAQVAWGELRARLEEFLVDDAGFFLHELLCFAVSPCRDMTAYDSAVRYPILPPS